MNRLTTERCVLRHWRDEDLDALAAINTDERVLEHLPGALTYDESRAMLARIRHHFDRRGFGLWCLEVIEPGFESPCIGFVGLQVPGFEAHFTPCIEVGWRIAPAFWGRGYATEAAAAAIDDLFERVGAHEIVSLTVPANRRSWSVMERLGMTRDPADDFEHPSLPVGDRLRSHVLYRLSQQRWAAVRKDIPLRP